MASDSKSRKNSAQRQPLPFEPTSTQKPDAGKKQAPTPPATSVNASTRMPEVVSKRMLSRMMIFCGMPTALGLAAFPAGYWIKSHDWLILPNVVVLLTTIGMFGLGFLGLSYGMLSASWDEEISGSALGWSEFKLNLSRLIQNWQAQRQQRNS